MDLLLYRRLSNYYNKKGMIDVTFKPISLASSD
jgi:hypothetical protein